MDYSNRHVVCTYAVNMPRSMSVCEVLGYSCVTLWIGYDPTERACAHDMSNRLIEMSNSSWPMRRGSEVYTAPGPVVWQAGRGQGRWGMKIRPAWLIRPDNTKHERRWSGQCCD